VSPSGLLAISMTPRPCVSISQDLGEPPLQFMIWVWAAIISVATWSCHMAVAAAWKVHGIEISDILHDEAVRAQDAALEQGWL